MSIPERYMVSAVPMGGGERVTGYLCKHYAKDRCTDGYVDVIQVCDELNCHVVIDPATIEPVKRRVRDIRAHTHSDGRGGYCPECDRLVLDDWKYCANCGQALDWEEER